MRFGLVFLEKKLGFFHRAHFFLFGLPNIGTFTRKRNIDYLLSKFSLNPKKIVDVGCGSGEFSFFLAEKFSQAKVIGLDKNLKKKILRGFAEKNCMKNLSFEENDFFCFKKKAGLVFAIESFEHFPSLGQALKKAFSTLEKGGHLLAHVPSEQWEKFEFFEKNNFPKYFDFVAKEHKQRGIRLETFCKEIEKNGFEMLYSKKTFGSIARFCWELDLLLMEKKLFLFRAFSLPFLKLACFFDPYFSNKNGKGILVLARKSRD